MIKPFLLLATFLIFIACNSDSKTSKHANVQTPTDEVSSSDLSKAIINNPNNGDLLYQRAQEYLNNQDYDNAIVDLKAAIDADSLKAEYYHLLSDTYLSYYRSKDGLLVMERAAETFPKRIPTLLKLSETQLILRQNENSLLTIARILTVDPDNAEAYFMTGMNFREMGEYDRAIGAFQKATELDPSITDAWLILGDLYNQKKDPIALQYLEAAINSAPSNPSTYHAKAFYLQNQDKIPEAIQLYKKINRIDKNYADAYLNAGILYITMDSLSQAFEQFNILANLKPQEPVSYYYRGVTHEKMGNLNKAKQDYTNALNLDPEYKKAKEALNNLPNS